MKPFDAIAPFYDLEHDGLTLDTTMYVALTKEIVTKRDADKGAGAAADGGQRREHPSHESRLRPEILVMGAGTGRVVRKLADAGFNVWGVDSSEPMLDRARTRFAGAMSSQLLNADMRSVDLKRKFDVVIVPFDTFTLLNSQGDQIRTLERCRAHVHSHGVVVVDIINPLVLPDPDQNRLRRHRFDVVEGHRTVSASDWVDVDMANQIMKLHVSYQVKSAGAPEMTEVELDVRWLYRYELEAVLSLAGLRVSQIWGNYDRSEYAADSARLIALAVSA